MRQLREIAQIIKGVSYDKAEAHDRSEENHVPILRAGNITDKLDLDDDLVWVPSRRVSTEQYLRQADIAICMSSGSASVVGKSAISEISWSGSVGAFCAIIRANSEQVHPSFVAYYLRTQAFREWASRSQGINIKNIKKSDLESFEMPVPPIDAQQRIVDILDRASSIQRLRKAADDKVRELVPALFVEMFGDPASNPKGWEFKPLREVSQIGSGITKGRKLDAARTISVPYLRVANVQDGRLDLTEIKSITIDVDEREKYALLSGDIVMTEGGDIDKLGRGYVWQDELPYCAHQNHVFRVRVDRSVLQPFFLSTLIGTSHGKSYFLRVAKRTTGIASINKTQLGELPVWLPPISMQNAFASRLEALHASQKLAGRAASTIDATTEALSRRLFG